MVYSQSESSESDTGEFERMYGRKRSKTDLLTMHELDDEFTNFLQGISYHNF